MTPRGLVVTAGSAVAIAIVALWVCVALAVLTGLTAAWIVAGTINVAVAFLGAVRHRGFPRVALFGFGSVALVLIFAAGDCQAAGAAVVNATVLVAFLACLFLLRTMIETAPGLPRVLAGFGAMTLHERRGGVQLLAWVFGLPLAVGATGIVVPLVRRETDTGDRVDLAEWAMRGVGLTVLYSPFTIAMAVVTSILAETRLVVLIGCGFLFSLALVTSSFLLAHARLPRRLGEEFWPAAAAVIAPVLGLVVVNISIIALSPLSPAQSGLLVIPACVLLAGLWTGPGRIAKMAEATVDSLRGYDAETAVFLSALLFAAAIRMTPGIDEAVGRLLTGVGPGPLIAFTALAITTLAIFGLHMVVSTSVLLGLFAPVMPNGLHTVLLGMAALAGWGFGGMCGVGAVSFLTCARMFGVEARRLALGRNLRFIAAVYVLCGVAVLLFA
ncbi:hypothetical protein ANTHELSMS3_04649 (plasmid) [Antarctobacter heliothermus]|uniref:Uncharacterized protein n=1 Tax=Antarctobacter heliothermus TaxID=74033 RepID=A0A222EBH5_9RHOB|nr:hypothetical protein [Antarctobacter heliothermus]ASP23547.1 hypothetical protein ANTHELSMS3_04649 [Antarctobacter heliothermus]